MDGSLSVIYGDGNCSRRATVRLGIDTLIANILVSYLLLCGILTATATVRSRNAFVMYIVTVILYR